MSATSAGSSAVMTAAAAVRGRPRAFSDDELIRVATAIGPDDLRLTDVAARLGVPRSTVYNRVASPEELGALVLSARLAAVLDAGWAPPGDGTWRDCLRSWVLHHRAAVLAGGRWIRFFQPDRHIDARSLTHAEQVLERLVAEGFSVAQAGRAIGFVGSVYRDSAVVRAAIAVPAAMFDSTRDTAEANGLGLVIAGLDANDPANEEAQFAYNLDRALDGIAASLGRGGCLCSGTG